MKRITLILIASGIILSSCNKDNDSIDINETLVDVGGYKLYALTSGTGTNTIIFESGLGDDSESWYVNNIFSSLALKNQVISYNRAGYSPSEPGIEPRNLIQLSEELNKVIIEISQNEKVVLVGHSLGGAIMRYYAIEHPEKVKAILLIDPSHESYKVIPQSEEDDIVQNIIDAGQLEIAKEAEQLIEDLAILEGLPNLPNVPVQVLTSIKLVNGLSLEDREDWSNAHKTLGEGIDNFIHIETENSGHYIQRDEPELVLNAINDLLIE